MKKTFARECERRLALKRPWEPRVRAGSALRPQGCQPGLELGDAWTDWSPPYELLDSRWSPMEEEHAEGEHCAVEAALAELPRVDFLVMFDLAPPICRADIMRLTAVGPATGAIARAADRRGEITGQVAHEVATALVQPLIESFAELLDSVEDPELSLGYALATVLRDWPPQVVRVFVELLWEQGGLPTEVLDREGLGILPEAESLPDWMLDVIRRESDPT